MKRSAKPAEPSPDADQMRPEYDFSHGVRGRHAHLFGEITEDETRVSEFLALKGFEVGPFEKSATRFAKTPDFQLFRGGQLVAFCEVKSFTKDRWLDEQIAQAATGELAGGLRPDPTYNRISNAVHTAAQQLRSVNPVHQSLNFLVLVNHGKAARCEDLVSVLTGQWDPLHGIQDETHTQYSNRRIREEKREIDLYLWFDLFTEHEPFKYRLVFLGNDKTRDQVCNMLEIDSKAIKNVG